MNVIKPSVLAKYSAIDGVREKRTLYMSMRNFSTCLLLDGDSVVVEKVRDIRDGSNKINSF